MSHDGQQRRWFWATLALSSISVVAAVFALVLENVSALSRDDPQVITDREVKPLLDPAGFREVLARGTEQTLAIEPLEKLAIERALRLTEGNRSKAALRLGISRDTLYRKLREFREETAN